MVLGAGGGGGGEAVVVVVLVLVVLVGCVLVIVIGGGAGELGAVTILTSLVSVLIFALTLFARNLSLNARPKVRIDS